MSQIGKPSATKSHGSGDPYRAAFRSLESAAAIIDISRDGILIDASDRFLITWQLERDAALGRPLEQIFPPHVAARLLHVARRAHAMDGMALTSVKSAGPSRARFSNLSVRASHLSGDMVFLNVTSGQPAQDASRIALLDDIGVVSGGLIYIYDVAKQRTRHINENLANLLGYAPGATVQLASVLPLIHSDDVQRVARHVADFATLKDGEVAKFSFRILRRSDSTWRWIENRTGVYARGAKSEVRRVVGYAYDVTVPHQTADDLALAANALLNAEAKERRRIARELHDSTAQHVVAADLMIAAHMRRGDAAKTGETKAGETLTLIRESLASALREIRTFSFLLHPPQLRDEGLIRVLGTFAEGFARRCGLTLDLKLPHMRQRLSAATEITLFRVCQEAFMNVRRHAQASHVSLRLSVAYGEVVLEIEDDGVGVGDVSLASMGVGIDGMRARLSSIGGAMSVEDTGHGTLFRARAPADFSGTSKEV